MTSSWRSLAKKSLSKDLPSLEEGLITSVKFSVVINKTVVALSISPFHFPLYQIEGKTGEHSIYTTFCGYEIMFHVSTLLPHSEVDKQQLEKKRHIGNDICCIVFQESSGESFKPSFIPTSISSHFLRKFLFELNLNFLNHNQCFSFSQRRFSWGQVSQQLFWKENLLV